MRITAVILAGGRGTRMGGLDKGLVCYASQRLIDHVLHRIQPQVDAILINANRNLATYQALGYPVVADENRQFDGPLAGMQAGLRQMTTEWLLSVPCDCPYLPVNLTTTLLEAANRAQAHIAIARSTSGWHPVCCLIHHSLLPSLDAFLASGQRKVSAWQMQQPHVLVDFADDQAFTNINQPPVPGTETCPTSR